LANQKDSESDEDDNPGDITIGGFVLELSKSDLKKDPPIALV